MDGGADLAVHYVRMHETRHNKLSGGNDSGLATPRCDVCGTSLKILAETPAFIILFLTILLDCLPYGVILYPFSDTHPFY